jgi:hypothetical protein
VKGYLYRFGAWLMHLFMVQVEVQVVVWYMLVKVIGTCCYRLITSFLVQVYNNIYHSGSVKTIPSLYFYVREVVRGKDRWL